MLAPAGTGSIELRVNVATRHPDQIDSRFESRTHSHFVLDGAGDGRNWGGLDFVNVIKSLITQLDSRYRPLPLAEVRDALNRPLDWINGMINRGQSIERRSEREFMIGVGVFVAGILLWSILPGAVVRSLPESWHAPEWMAARMLGVEAEVAEQCLIEAADKADRQ